MGPKSKITTLNATETKMTLTLATNFTQGTSLSKSAEKIFTATYHETISLSTTKKEIISFSTTGKSFFVSSSKIYTTLGATTELTSSIILTIKTTNETARSSSTKQLTYKTQNLTTLNLTEETTSLTKLKPTI